MAKPPQIEAPLVILFESGWSVLSSPFLTTSILFLEKPI